MTFEELVKKVATQHEISLDKTDSIIRQALNLAADAAKTGIAPLFPGIGRFKMVAVRATGRKVDGTVWSKPGRSKLALSVSIHRGGTRGKTQSESVLPAARSVA